MMCSTRIACHATRQFIAWLSLGCVSFGFGSSLGAQEVTEVAGRDLAGWVADFDSDNEIVRLRAVKSLGPFGKSALPAFAQALDDPSAGVRYWAASHLGALGPAAASTRERLLELEADQEFPGVQLAAAYALCAIEGPDGHLDRLAERLKYPERGMACSAADFLGRLGEIARPAVPDLERAYFAHSRTDNPLRIANPDYHVQGACQNALRQIVPGWQPGDVPTND